MSNEPTTPLSTWDAPDETQRMPLGPPPSGPPPGSPSGPRRPRKVAAGVIAAAVLAGGAAGFGGAALWSAVDDDPSPSLAGTGSNSNIADDDPAPAGSVEAVSQKVLPSVVRLDVTAKGTTTGASGSGVILSEDGEILTNEHVVTAGGEIENGEVRVSFSDGSDTTAEVIGTDPLTDTALLKAKDVDGLTPIAVGRSRGLDVGQQVVAIGSPFGLDSTVTSGIVSALDRPVDVGSDGEGNATVYPAIQTDAAINPGNSGGALVNMRGELVGINSSIRTAGSFVTDEAGSIGLGFAIPLDYLQPVIEQIRDGDTPTHARIGITVSDVGAPAAPDDGEEGQPEEPGDLLSPSPEEQPQRQIPLGDGAEVREITKGTPGAEAGFEAGDIITKVDDKLIAGSDSLVATIRSYRPGDEVEITFERDGEEQTVTVELASDTDE